MSTDLRRRARILLLPGIAGILFIYAVVAVIEPARSRADPPQVPATSSYGRAISGIGTVEPQSELIEVATEVPGIVRSVAVRAGDSVVAGQPLVLLDRRTAQAAVREAHAGVSAAEAALRQAELAAQDERQRLSLFESVSDRRAISADEIERRRFAARRAAAAVAVARTQVQSARALLQVRLAELSRLTITAPVTGRIFRVNVRPGEYASSQPGAAPILTMGEDRLLHVRTEFDEADAPGLCANAPAQGVLRGDPGRRVPLTFVRLEPQAVEKRALAGGSERVDTRVVEAIYSFDPSKIRAFLGQRMDVFVERNTRKRCETARP
jgi:RND family efflux transporter MFP subunit